MKLKATSQYALQILAHMSNDKDGQHTAKNLSESLNIPYKYLTRIMTNLAKDGFICSTRGKYGGFVFAKPLEDIKIYDVLASLNDVNEDVCLMGEGLCSKEEHCVLHDAWSKPKQLIDEMLKNSSLKDLQKIKS
ncbi:MAG: Rrf2 family transcriptional regulator [Campylobacteraceae bacterium]|nr:Rrf2 family transcriptional regulator [Campylobacteraceae bacterium]